MRTGQFEPLDTTSGLGTTKDDISVTPVPTNTGGDTVTGTGGVRPAADVREPDATPYGLPDETKPTIKPTIMQQIKTWFAVAKNQKAIVLISASLCALTGAYLITKKAVKTVRRF